MKQKIIILLTIYLLFNSALSAQNIEKMNKSELREHIVNLTTKIDSLKNENINLQESISNLSTNSTSLVQKNKKNELEISRINELILKNENERKRIISEHKIVISKLNEIIITLKDSISSVQSSSNVVSTSRTFNSNDFLNKYYFDQIPLPNNSFSLVLSKLVYGDKRSDNNYRYGDDNYQGSVERLPEILDANAFTYWGVKPNVMITDGTNFNNYVISKNSDYFNSKLPKIEVLKNKLFTIKYNDGSEESFLFNVKQTKSEDNNNQRKILQIELANEEVKADGSNNTAKDIVWRFFAIENECYLALTLGQLNRLRLKLLSVNKGLEVYSQNNQEFDYVTNFNNNYYRHTTTGQGMYISRNKDFFMDSSKYINPEEIIYLFKLK
jgi:cell division protein FtsB